MTDSKKNKMTPSWVQTGIGILAAILALLIVVMMYLVSGIQGTARVVNYAGLVRGKTQRLVKMEIAGQPQDGMLTDVESFIHGLRYGDDDLDIVRLDDAAFQDKMEELDDYFGSLKDELMLVRREGYQATDIIPKSEEFFNICDQATGLAEVYSQKRATALEGLEKYITADIVCLMALIVYALVQALRYAAMNRALQHKVYVDGATGLPNKNKCEELLSDPEIPGEDVGVCSFDLNDLRRINNSMGHEAGDAYIRSFDQQLRLAMPQQHFVGRAGGDEFLAVTHGLDRAALDQCLDGVRRHMADYNQNHPDMPISYAVGAALAREEGPCTMRELFNAADKNMYINGSWATPSPTAYTATLGRTPIGSFGAASPSSWPPTAATPGRWSRSWPSRWPQRTAAGYGNSSSPALWAVSWGRTPPPFRCSISPAAAARQPTAV